jgi:predicted house-cleaning noncanonical NTP pyrophosphatase (MazG superfamily)
MAKLVRDRIPEICRASGQEPVTRVANGAEMGPLLRAKLLEEAHEVGAARPEELAGELADVLEVVSAIAAHAGITRAELELARHDKRVERGGFTERIVWAGNRETDREAGQ